MPLYFPRSKSEEDFAAYHLPYDVGNEDGEPVIAERGIRIIPKPTYTHVPVNNGMPFTFLLIGSKVANGVYREMYCLSSTLPVGSASRSFTET